MAAVHGVVMGHKGALHLESALGEGTTIRALFPALVQTAPPSLETTGKNDSESVPPLEGTVLVVDDEAALRKLNSKILQKTGNEIAPVLYPNVP